MNVESYNSHTIEENLAVWHGLLIYSTPHKHFGVATPYQDSLTNFTLAFRIKVKPHSYWNALRRKILGNCLMH